MSDTPPRRRRPDAQRPAASLPLIPILLGVIVLGFAIGAGLSYLTRRGDTVVALATASPLAQPLATSPARPLATRTPRPLARVTPAPRPTLAATAEATEPPAPTQAPATQAPATHAPATQTPATQTPATQAPASQAPATQAPATSAPTPRPTRTPLPTPAPTAPPTLTPIRPPGPYIAADGAFATTAASVVRSYLDALIAGDDAAARARLGGSDSLSEKAFVDGDTTIDDIESHPSADGASVDVTLSTPKGPVSAHYLVARNASGAYIRSHDFVKP